MTTTIAVFQKTQDAGKPLDVAKELTTADLIQHTVVGSTQITGAPQSKTLTDGAEVLLSPLSTIAANTLSDPLTDAEVLLFKYVGDDSVAAAAAETPEPPFQVTGNGNSASSTSNQLVASFTVPKTGDYVGTTDLFQTLTSNSGFSRVSQGIGIVKQGDSITTAADRLFYQYWQRDNPTVNVQYDLVSQGFINVASTNPHAAIRLEVGVTYQLWRISNTGNFRDQDSVQVTFEHQVDDANTGVNYLTGNGDERLTGDSAFGKPIWARDFMQDVSTSANGELQILAASQVDKFIGVAFGTIGSHGRGEGIAWGSVEVLNGTPRVPMIYQHSSNGTVRMFTPEGLSSRRCDLVLLYTKP